MKKITILLSLAFLIIAAVMIYLVKTGVSLRTAPYIRPSLVSADFLNVPDSVFTRIFPELQSAHYIIWGLPEMSDEAVVFVKEFTRRYEEQFKAKVNMLADPLQVSKDDVEKCEKPCWIFLPQDRAHQLALNEWIEQNVWHLKRNYITMTWMDFVRNPEVPTHCVEEKRLDFECLPLVAIKDVERKFREPNKRYFFMRKYQDQDFFLFVEKSHQ